MASAEEMCPAVPPAVITARKPPEMSLFFAVEAWLIRSTERQQTVEEERVSRVGASLLGG